MAIESTLKRIWIRVRDLYDPAKDSKRRQYEFYPDPGDTSPLIQEVRSRFEGREAIYLEKGAIRVRVSNIRGSASQATIAADVEEISTPGLGVGSFYKRLHGDNKPLRWNIAAGIRTTFSGQDWAMGYGGWWLYFHPKVIEGVLDLAARFPAIQDSQEHHAMIQKHYDTICHFLHSRPDGTFSGANSRRVFPEIINPSRAFIGSS